MLKYLIIFYQKTSEKVESMYSWLILLLRHQKVSEDLYTSSGYISLR